MQRRTFITRGVAVLGGLAALGSAALRGSSVVAQTNTGWITLFDGKNLDMWNKIGDANWAVADGAVAASSGTGFLVSKNSYKDFEIRAEFWADEEANSGIFLRCSDPQKVTAANAYEVNIFDKRPDPTYGTGAIVDLAKVSPMPKAAGKWNTYEITAKGGNFTVVLNGTKTVDNASDAKHTEGPIALQHAAGTIKFRKVEIKPL